MSRSPRLKGPTLILAVVGILAWVSEHSALAARTELLSMKGFPIGKNQYVDQFEIQTWGVKVWAMCHLPTPGWRITAGSDGTLAGILAGKGGIVSAAGLPPAELHRLDDLFLISVDEYQALPRGDPKTRYWPATFAGWVRLGTYGGDWPGRKIRLTPQNFARMPAARCPDPPAAAE